MEIWHDFCKIQNWGNSVIQLQTWMLNVLPQTRPLRLARMAGADAVNNCSHQTLSFASGG